MPNKLPFLLRIVLPIIVLALLAVLLGGSGETTLSPAGNHEWMVADEFGRNTWRILAFAMLYSLGKGLIITLIVSVFAAAFAYLGIRDDKQLIRLGLRASCAVVESVPLVLWVVIVVVAVHGPRLWITFVAFGVLVLPSVTQIFLGEFTRLRSMPFVEAARLLGISEVRIFTAYLLPAALPVLIPVLIQLLGSAIAVDGAIGVFGLGNRSDIDLGIFLLRGKEQFITRPDILISALVAYGALYAYLRWLASGLSSTNQQVNGADASQ